MRRKKDKTKTFQSESINRLLRLERLTLWAVPALIAAGALLLGSNAMLKELKNDFSLATLGGVVLFIIIYTIVMSSIPVYIIKAGFRNARKQQIRNSSFITVQDFDYYREKLTGLRPGAISLITDLKLEQKKDVAASLLKFEDMGIIYSENGRYYTTDLYQGADLRPSDRYLVDNLIQNSFNTGYDLKWQKMVEAETVEDGYIVPKKFTGGKSTEAKRQAAKGCLPTLLMVIAALWVYKIFESRIDAMLEAFDAAVDLSLGGQMRYLINNPEYLLLTGLMLALVIILLRGFWFPFAMFASSLGIKFSMVNYNRSDLGNEMAEYVFGMKNFIHDFSNLNQAEKEHLVLWDDYLVYAVVLEENRQIVDEIINIRKSRRV